MFCGECGTKNEEGAKVCKKCGNSLSFDAKEFVKDTTSNIKEKFKKISEKEGKTYFSQKKYLSYIAYFQVIVWIIYALFLIGGFIVGCVIGFSTNDNPLLGIIILILCVGIAYVSAWFATLFINIRIQEMRWKVDLHNFVQE